ncbi:MAG: acyl-CoA synthetase [Proteobacteria bacterium]|nr:acyl-CoA synthetase [Pseudomonadota bacterium]
MSPINPFEENLPKNQANYSPLTPLSFLTRTAEVFPERAAVIHGEIKRSWRETLKRCTRLASALKKKGVVQGTTVSVMAPNVPELLEAHFGVLMTGGVLNALNIRLEAQTLAYILEHGESQVLITDREFSPVIQKVLQQLEDPPLVIDIDDPMAEGGELLGEMDYEAFLKTGDENFEWNLPEDEWQAVSLNYTSGTTGKPKGVVYHSRGAHLLAIDNILAWGMRRHPVYLWTLPMFHCNGWCFPWTITLLAGTHVCLRKVNAANIYDSIVKHGVTHLCGAPIVMGMIANAEDQDQRVLSDKVQIMTAAAPPPPPVIARMEEMGFQVTHVYGLTETYGPSVVSAWQEEWNKLSPTDQALKKGRQGVNYPGLEGLMVADSETLKEVPSDGQTLGEVFMKGNLVMKGYFKNPEATQEAFRGGWFHSGDLGVRHPDGYIELKDRAKDIIISGGENISSVEIENTLYRHSNVLEAAVVARPDEQWGETPCAFVTLKPGSSISEGELILFCREQLAGFKVPKSIIFQELPKTSTGKIRKNILREQASRISEQN